MTTHTDADAVSAALRDLVGSDVHRAAVGHGSFLTLDLGAAHGPAASPLPVEPADVEPADPGREGHRLWVTHALWRVEQGDELVAASDDDRDQLDRAADRLVGRRVVGVRVEPPALDTTVDLDERVRLRLVTASSDDPDQWIWFRPDGRVLVIGPGARWSLERPEPQPASEVVVRDRDTGLAGTPLLAARLDAALSRRTSRFTPVHVAVITAAVPGTVLPSSRTATLARHVDERVRDDVDRRFGSTSLVGRDNGDVVVVHEPSGRSRDALVTVCQEAVEPERATWPASVGVVGTEGPSGRFEAVVRLARTRAHQAFDALASAG